MSAYREPSKPPKASLDEAEREHGDRRRQEEWKRLAEAKRQRWMPTAEEIVAELKPEEKLDLINRARGRRALKLLGKLPEPRKPSDLEKAAVMGVAGGLVAVLVNTVMSSRHRPPEVDLQLGLISAARHRAKKKS